MRLPVKHIIQYGIASVIAAVVFFFLLKSVYKDSVEIDCYAKAFGNADVQLFYNKKAPDFDVDQSDKNLLIASQFYKNVAFLVPSPEYTRFLRLDLGDEENLLEVQKVELIIKSIGKKDTIKRWSGQDIRELVGRYNDVTIDAANISYIQFKAGKDDPYLVLNEVIHQEVNAYYRKHQTGNTGVLLTAILLSLFLMTTIRYVLSHWQFPGWGYLIQHGYVLIGGAAGIIFLVFLNNHTALIPDKKNAEQRKMAPEPLLTTENFFEYPDMFSDYARDNFSFRNALFYMNALYKAKLFHEPVLPKEVIIGRDGWFFDNEVGNINDFRNLAEVPQAELAIITINMTQKRNWLAKKNIKFYIIIPPNKHQVYPEMMPAGYTQTTGLGQNRLDLYTRHLEIHGHLHLIDPRDSLLSAKKRQDVYYKTDTHWNLFGGFKGYQALMQEISKDFPGMAPLKESDFTISTFNSNEGDLAKMISLQNVYLRKEYALIPNDKSIQLVMPDRSDIQIEYHDNKTVNGSHLKLLMFRDSYANYLIPFLNLHFKDATYLWTYEFMDKIIEEQQPDVVIFECLQRFMPGAFLTSNPANVQ